MSITNHSEPAVCKRIARIDEFIREFIPTGYGSGGQVVTKSVICARWGCKTKAGLLYPVPLCRKHFNECMEYGDIRLKDFWQTHRVKFARSPRPQERGFTRSRHGKSDGVASPKGDAENPDLKGAGLQGV